MAKTRADPSCPLVFDVNVPRLGATQALLHKLHPLDDPLFGATQHVTMQKLHERKRVAYTLPLRRVCIPPAVTRTVHPYAVTTTTATSATTTTTTQSSVPSPMTWKEWNEALVNGTSSTEYVKDADINFWNKRNASSAVNPHKFHVHRRSLLRIIPPRLHNFKGVITAYGYSKIPRNHFSGHIEQLGFDFWNYCMVGCTRWRIVPSRHFHAVKRAIPAFVAKHTHLPVHTEAMRRVLSLAFWAKSIVFDDAFYTTLANEEGVEVEQFDQTTGVGVAADGLAMHEGFSPESGINEAMNYVSEGWLVHGPTFILDFACYAALVHLDCESMNKLTTGVEQVRQTLHDMAIIHTELTAVHESFTALHALYVMRTDTMTISERLQHGIQCADAAAQVSELISRVPPSFETAVAATNTAAIAMAFHASGLLDITCRTRAFNTLPHGWTTEFLQHIYVDLIRHLHCSSPSSSSSSSTSRKRTRGQQAAAKANAPFEYTLPRQTLLHARDCIAASLNMLHSPGVRTAFAQVQGASTPDQFQQQTEFVHVLDELHQFDTWDISELPLDTNAPFINHLDDLVHVRDAGIITTVPARKSRRKNA